MQRIVSPKGFQYSYIDYMELPTWRLIQIVARKKGKMGTRQQQVKQDTTHGGAGKAKGVVDRVGSD